MKYEFEKPQTVFLANPKTNKRKVVSVSQYVSIEKNVCTEISVVRFDDEYIKEGEGSSNGKTWEEGLEIYRNRIEKIKSKGFVEDHPFGNFLKIMTNPLGYVAALGESIPGFSGHDSIFIYRIMDGEIRFLDVLAHDDLQETGFCHIMDFRFFHHSNKLISVGESGNMMIWDLDTLAKVKELKYGARVSRHGSEFLINISHDDLKCILNTGSVKNRTAVWDLGAFKKVLFDKDADSNLCFLPGDSSCYLGAKYQLRVDGAIIPLTETVKICSAETGETIKVLDFDAVSISFSPAGNYAWVMRENPEHRRENKLWLWKYKTTQELIELPFYTTVGKLWLLLPPTRGVFDIEEENIYYSPASGFEERTRYSKKIYRYNISSGKTELIHEHENKILSLAMLGGKKLVLGVNHNSNIALVDI